MGLRAVRRGIGVLAAPALLSPLAVLSVVGTTAPVGAQLAVHGARIVVAGPNTSSNWFGYSQGTLEQQSLGRGIVTFHGIRAHWTVPAASQHQSGQAEASATWAGIGGGYLDSNGTVTDGTLIQAGTEQDVDANGTASYTAWWEVVPGPSITISNVHAGDSMFLDIHEVAGGSELWLITLVDNGQTLLSITVPYSSSYATAEWVEETPLKIGGGTTGIASLPNLSSIAFDNARTWTYSGTPTLSPTWQSPGLVSGEEINLVNGSVTGTPSAPDSDQDGFNECANATSCSTFFS